MCFLCGGERELEVEIFLYFFEGLLFVLGGLEFMGLECELELLDGLLSLAEGEGEQLVLL